MEAVFFIYASLVGKFILGAFYICVHSTIIYGSTKIDCLVSGLESAL